MEINPLNIFMFLLRAAPAIVSIVIIVAFTTMLQAEIKTDDAERASLELSENLFASQLTAGKYVFSERLLDENNQKDKDRKTELPFLRMCSYGYFIKIEDLQSAKAWEFGYKRPPTTTIDARPSAAVGVQRGSEGGYTIGGDIERVFFAAVAERDERLPGNYYGTARQARVEIKIYDTWLTRSTCLVEKAFELGERQEMAIPCIVADVRGGEQCGFSLQRHHSDASLACSFQRSAETLTTSSRSEERDCRYLPQSVRFEPIDELFTERAGELAMKIVAYPIKEGANIPGCDEAKSGIGTAGKSDNVQTVLLCAERINQGNQ
jgi:hypothetical protein